jgi:hypothetical protein
MAKRQGMVKVEGGIVLRSYRVYPEDLWETCGRCGHVMKAWEYFTRESGHQQRRAVCQTCRPFVYVGDSFDQIA